MAAPGGGSRAPVAAARNRARPASVTAPSPSALPPRTTRAPGDGDQLHRLAFARLEADRGPGRDVEPHAVGAGPIELQRPVGLDEGVVAAHLDRPVAEVEHREAHRLAAGVQLDLPGGGHHLARRRGPRLRPAESAAGTGRKLPCSASARSPCVERDGVVHGDQLGAVGEGALDLHLGDELGDAGQHLRPAEHPPAQVHQLGHAPAVADELEELRGDERHRLRVVQPQAAGQALLGENARAVKDELVDVTRRQMHRASRDRPPAGREGCRGDCAADAAAAAPRARRAGAPAHPPRSGLADSTSGAPATAGPASTRARTDARHGGEERTDEEQGADGPEAAHPGRRARPCAGSRSQVSSRYGGTRSVLLQRVKPQRSRPAESTSHSASERARGERHLGALGVARAGEAGRGVGGEHQRPALGHPGHGRRRAAPGRAEDPRRPLRGDEGARAGADRRCRARAGRRRPARRRACWCRPRPRCRGSAG